MTVPVALVAMLGTGCHSAYIDAVVVNNTSAPVTLLEVDYPSASFGTQLLGSRKEFHYRFKVQGTGNLKLLWTDPKQQEHSVDGPDLAEGSEGSFRIVIAPDGVEWQPHLKK